MSALFPRSCTGSFWIVFLILAHFSQFPSRTISPLPSYLLKWHQKAFCWKPWLKFTPSHCPFECFYSSHSICDLSYLFAHCWAERPSNVSFMKACILSVLFCLPLFLVSRIVPGTRLMLYDYLSNKWITQSNINLLFSLILRTLLIVTGSK